MLTHITGKYTLADACSHFNYDVNSHPLPSCRYHRTIAAASWHTAAAYAVNQHHCSHARSHNLLWGHEGPRKLTPLLWGFLAPGGDCYMQWRSLLSPSDQTPHPLLSASGRNIHKGDLLDTHNSVNGLYEPYGNKQVLTRVGSWST